MAGPYHALICGILFLACASVVRADVEEFSLRRSLFQQKGTVSSCTVSGSTAQAQCYSFYRNVADGIKVDGTSSLRVAQGVFPETANTGIFATQTYAAAARLRLATDFTGQTTLGANGVATSLYGANAGLDALVGVVLPNAGATGAFAATSAAARLRLATEFTGQTAVGADSAAEAIVPADGNTGLFAAASDDARLRLATEATGQLALGANGVATSLYGANAGIANLVTKIFDNYPNGAAGTIDQEEIVLGSTAAVYDVSANCGADVLLGGTTEVYCTSTPVGAATAASATDLKVIASYVGGFISTTVKTGTGGVVAATYVVNPNGATSVYHTQGLCGLDANNDGDNSKGCACFVKVTPFCI